MLTRFKALSRVDLSFLDEPRRRHWMTPASARKFPSSSGRPSRTGAAEERKGEWTAAQFYITLGTRTFKRELSD